MSKKILGYAKMEYLTLGNNAKIVYVLCPVFTLLLLMFFNSYSMGAWLLNFMLPTVILSPFFREDNKKIEVFYAVLPSTPRQIVTGRFLYLWEVTGGGAAVAVLIYMVCIWLGILTGIADLYLLWLSILLIASVMCFEYIICYRFGVVLARYASSLLSVVPAVVFSLLSNYLYSNRMQLTNFFAILERFGLLFVLCGVLVFMVSTGICIAWGIRIYKRKEL